MLRLLLYVIIGYLVWKIFRLLTSSGGPRVRKQDRSQEFPEDASYKHIEDADFEDISSDPDKPS